MYVMVVSVSIYLFFCLWQDILVTHRHFSINKIMQISLSGRQSSHTLDYYHQFPLRYIHC